MNRNELEGKKENVKGRVKEAVGSLTGNKKLESKGANERWLENESCTSAHRTLLPPPTRRSFQGPSEAGVDRCFV
jgi:hypothetical protein